MSITANFGVATFGVQYQQLSPTIKAPQLTVSFTAEIEAGNADATDPQSDGNIELSGIAVQDLGDGGIAITSGIRATDEDGNIVVCWSESSPVATENALSATFRSTSFQPDYSARTLVVDILPPIARQISGDVYTGDYSVTPSTSPVVLQTSGKAMSGNVIVNPIPQNYGLITWNGSFLTVS